MSRPRSRRSRWRLVGLVAGLLLVGELVPSPLPRHPAFERYGPDKLLHLLGHAGLGASLADALAGERAAALPAAVLAVAVSTAYARLLGRVQERVPGRASEPADHVAALLGSVIGAALWIRRAASGDAEP